MSQRLIIHFPLHFSANWSLRELKSKGKFQLFCSKSGRGRLREVVAYKRFLYSDSTFGKLDDEEEVVATGGSAVYVCVNEC